MTTQSGSTSPFQTGAENKDSNPQEEFTFRTMQDDLLSAQKNPAKTNNQQAATTAAAPQPMGGTPFDVPVQKEIRKETPIASASPFAEQTKPLAGPATTPRESKIVEVSTPDTTYVQPNNSNYKTIISLIILMIVIFAGLGGYYFWMTRASKQTPATTQPTIETTTPIQTVETPVVVAPPAEKYSATKPNYLIIDLATLSDKEIQAAISNVANEFKNIPTQVPYEFVIVDANNNPIAFPIFATAAKLNFSPALLATLGENFSFFIFNDNSNIRFGFSVDISKADIFAAELQKQEATLPTDLSFMFPGATPDTISGSFKDNSYNGTKIRYFNLDTQATLSIDYAIKDNEFILGTSKNTERAILDKLSQPKDTTNTNIPTPAQEPLAQ